MINLFFRFIIFSFFITALSTPLLAAELPADQKASSKGLVISSHEIATTGDITGYIRNDYRMAYTNIVIQVDLFDAKKKKIDRISGYTGASLLRPKKKTQFTIPIPFEYQKKFISYKIVTITGTPKYEPKWLSN